MSFFNAFMRITLEAELADLMSTPTQDVTPDIEMRILYTLELLDSISHMGNGGNNVGNGGNGGNDSDSESESDYVPDPSVNDSDSDNDNDNDNEMDNDSGNDPDNDTDTDSDDTEAMAHAEQQINNFVHNLTGNGNTGQLIGGMIDALGNIYAVFQNAAQPVYEDVPVPLSEADISAFEVPSCIDTVDHPRCAVCMCDFDSDSPGTVYKLPCKHHYHMDCIREWFKIKPFCPCCKQDMRTIAIDTDLD